MPSRLTPAHLRQLLADGGRPAAPPPDRHRTDPPPGGPVEVERLVNGDGLIARANRQHPVGSQFAGRRVTVRLDRGLLQLVADGVLLRSLPNPLNPAEIARLRDARPAGPAPRPAPEPLGVQPRVSGRGTLVIAGQSIQVGTVHAGRTLTVQADTGTLRVLDGDGDRTLIEVARTTTNETARFTARKPQSKRRPVQPDLSPINRHRTVTHQLESDTPCRHRPREGARNPRGPGDDRRPSG